MATCMQQSTKECASEARTLLVIFTSIKIEEKIGTAVEKRTKTRVVVMENYLYKETSNTTSSFTCMLSLLDFINVM